ncbi:hypothetical protein [Burkholderia multivorans]|uniref:hypothetical protein n=1 Tax=Burkholderia multivorans TaxID=87883 RepID=UPI000F4E2030|nr:hypothetical protein [Burkholderia multivorans]MBU9120247.1 hypothetical protein [Burkholderia multivorans]
MARAYRNGFFVFSKTNRWDMSLAVHDLVQFLSGTVIRQEVEVKISSNVAFFLPTQSSSDPDDQRRLLVAVDAHFARAARGGYRIVARCDA